MKQKLKHIGLLTLICLFLIEGKVAHADGLLCRHGLSWHISQNSMWGWGKPVITRIQPYSSSADAGLRVGDIIEMIDGYSTNGLNFHDVQNLLQSNRELHTLQTSSFGSSKQKHILGLQCKTCGSLQERELAELFSLYSLEDANQSHIIYPYTYQWSNTPTLKQTSDYTLAEVNPQTTHIDETINKELHIVLSQKGLKFLPDADLMFSSYYELLPLASSAEEYNAPFSWRYDRHTNGLKPFPLYNYQNPDIQNAKYKLTFGIVLQSKQNKKILWSCEANEYLSEAISVEEYAQSAIATMLLGFPYISTPTAPTLQVRTLHYNYTGIVYSNKRLNVIVDVEDNSPAMKAGLRPGDIIRAINAQKIHLPQSDDLLNHYFKTAQTMERYREKNIPPLRPMVGDIPLSYWQVKDYEHIANFIKQRNNSTAFTYLFGFRPYIAREHANILFEIERDGQIYFVPITPEYRDESTINF